MMKTNNKIVTEWLTEFTERIRVNSNSRKVNFTYKDAVQRSKPFCTDVDKILIKYLRFINTNPLNDNDYFKYVEAYKNGKQLNLKYFRHSIDKLKSYYTKVDANKLYNPFNIDSYKDYVLFMMLKLNGIYKKDYDEVFNVKTNGNRVYTPLSKIPSVLRGVLPFKVKEYDIARAFPTFIDIELNITNRTKDVYSLIDKVKFNTLLNTHQEVKNADINNVRSQLKPIYGNLVDKVVTNKRFNNKGRMFKDLTIYEAKAIQQFVKENNIKNFARLHDGIFVLNDTKAEITSFDSINFLVKECIKPKIIDNTKKTFYNFDSSNKLITSPKQYADFFEQENFIRGCEDGNDKLIIFQDTNNVVKPFNYKTETVKYLKSEINELVTDEVENRIAKESFTAVNQAYLLLPSKPVKYYTDKANEFGLPFKNGFFKFDTDKDFEFIQMQYKEVDGFFAPHRTQKHNFSECTELSEFEVFLTMVSTGKDPRQNDLTKDEIITFHNFCNMFGYLCHSYKDHSFSPAIILSDDGANDLNRNGGRGKTILTEALKSVQPSILKGGNEFNPSYIHNFADLKSDKRIYVIDDVPAGFNYDSLYTNIIGGINCQRKGTEAISIPFSKSPKFIITTNWAVRYNVEDSSTNRRFFEYKFTDFFNINNTPIKVFGHRLFDDWDSKEWNRFYNFTYCCVASYLKNGLQRVEYDKNNDNFRAIFSNDVVLNEFERIFNIIKYNQDGFNVSDFMKEYNKFDNPLKFDKLFSHKNVKTFINTYLIENKLKITYYKSTRKWVKEEVEVEF